MKLAGNSFCPSPNYKRATWVTIPVWYATSMGQTGGGSRSKVLVVLKHCSPIIIHYAKLVKLFQ